MLELLFSLVLAHPIGIFIGICATALIMPSTGSIMSDIHSNEQSDSQKARHNSLYNHYDNLSTYEIDKSLKEDDLFNTYGDYSRETKINKLVEREEYFNN